MAYKAKVWMVNGEGFEFEEETENRMQARINALMDMDVPFIQANETFFAKRHIVSITVIDLEKQRKEIQEMAREALRK